MTLIKIGSRASAGLVCALLSGLAASPVSAVAAAPRPAAATVPAPLERLDRGLVALRAGEGEVFLSWRLLGGDPAGTLFNVYRVREGGRPELVNARPLDGATSLLDAGAGSGRLSYHVRPVWRGREYDPSPAFAVAAGESARPYLEIALQAPPVSADPGGYEYHASDGSVGDLDGDGRLELVLKWEPSNSKDNSHPGRTGPVYLDAYRLDGASSGPLWRINLGRNIRAGAHYTQFMVYDLDGDGRAEVACKTADGTVDGLGRVIGDAAADHRNATGYVLRGPEFLTVFDGRTGAAIDTAPYLPPRHPDTTEPSGDQLKALWGDGYGNRVDRFVAGVASLDGRSASLIMARGYYTRTVLAAWDLRGGKLVSRWVFDSHAGPAELRDYAGQGNHQLSVADVDADGRDEIIYGAMTLDDDGRGLYTTRLHHGDALHVSDLDPERPGLEVFSPHESPRANGGIGSTFRDARTGKVWWSTPAPRDVGRGVAFDIDPRHPGAEAWASNSNRLYSAKGEVISETRPRSMNFAVWWDGDPQRELLDRTAISKWNAVDATETRLLTADGCAWNNGTKANPVLSGDILGDWREEVVWRTADSRFLRIYVSTIPTPYRHVTLLHDRQYRLALAWQNVAYNQPPHPSFDMETRLRPPTARR